MTWDEIQRQLPGPLPRPLYLVVEGPMVVRVTGQMFVGAAAPLSLDIRNPNRRGVYVTRRLPTPTWKEVGCDTK